MEIRPRRLRFLTCNSLCRVNIILCTSVYPPAKVTDCLWAEILWGERDGIRSSCPGALLACLCPGWCLNLSRGVTLYLHQHKWCLRLGQNCCCLSALQFNVQCKIPAQPGLKRLVLFPAEAVKHRQQFIQFTEGFASSGRHLFCYSIFNCSNPNHDFIICSPGK